MRAHLPGPRAPTLAKARRSGGPRPLGGPEGRAAACGASGATRESPEAGGEVSPAADVSSGAGRAGQERSVRRTPRLLSQPGHPSSGGASCSRRRRTKARGRRCRGERGAAAGERPGPSRVGVGGAEFGATLSEDAPESGGAGTSRPRRATCASVGTRWVPAPAACGERGRPQPVSALGAAGAWAGGRCARLRRHCFPAAPGRPLPPNAQKLSPAAHQFAKSDAPSVARSPVIPPVGTGVGGFALGCEGEFIASGI